MSRESFMEHKHMCVKNISWTAVFVGALVGVGLAFLLNLFSVAIGLAAFSLDQNGMVTLAVSGFIAALIGAIVSMFLTGWVAAYLGRPFCVKRNLGVLYGFTAWCLALLIMVLTFMPVSRYVSVYTNFLSNPASLTVVASSPRIVMTAPVPSSTPKTVTNPPSVHPAIGIGAFMIFILFIIGALASCIGGHCGMTYRKNEYGNDIS